MQHCQPRDVHEMCADWQLYNRSTPKNLCSVHFECVTIIRQALDVRDVSGFQLKSPGSNICSIEESEPIVSLNRGSVLLMIEYYFEVRFGDFPTLPKVKIENNELTKNNEIFGAGAKSDAGGKRKL